ncbi:MAG: V-type ATPase 116kDa subunit family protein [Patescibacteria group bacterium]|nr:V-type ATPase 116kDa subunit family protein [Patescibacteria group bacterium]
MLKLFFAAGAFTALLGMIYSGWLGLTPADLPGPLGTFAQKIAMIDPMTDAYLMLGISFGLGIIHVLFGVFIAMLRALKAKRFMDAIADFLVWLYFIPVLLLYALAATDAYLPQYTELFLNLAYVGVFLVFLAGTRGASWVMKIPSGILNLYNLVSYGSDVLSYSRLLALGLATGIIAMAVNEIALLPITDADGVVHWTSFSVIFTVMILIFGHLFNLALNMLGAYIHSARLQFVEFFGKFLDGGGVEFKPFDSSGKYTDLIKK